jgi:hypothetical protein
MTVKCLRYVFSDSEATPVFSLKIPLFKPMDTTQESRQAATPSHSEITDTESEQAASPSHGETADNESEQTTSPSHGETVDEGSYEMVEAPPDIGTHNPHELTDKAIAEILSALSQIPSVAPSPISQQQSLDDVMDQDLRDVLGMDIGDFVV